jgi:hypothetical protein
MTPLALRLIGTGPSSFHSLVSPLPSSFLSFPYPLSHFHFTSTYYNHFVLSRLTLHFHLEPPLHSLDKPILREAPLELEKSQPKERGRAIEVTVGSLPKLESRICRFLRQFGDSLDVPIFFPRHHPPLVLI